MTTLLCLPPAGSGTADYRGWSEYLPASIAMAPVQLPGREAQLGTPSPASMSALVEWIASSVDPPADYALYGHSFGGWVAFELAHAFAARGRPPRHLFIGARRAPDQPSPFPPLHQLDDGAFTAAVQERYGAIPEPLLARPAILALFLPTLRADFTAMETWTPQERPPLDLPITAFRGLADTTVQRAEIAAWKRYTARAFGLRQLPGGHFFHREDPELLCDAIAGSLR